ncbi:MAG: DUF2269 family protein [Gemmatimonadota bacterium]
MRPVWIFLHLLGPVAWLGGAFASMIIGSAARGGDAATLERTVRLQAALHRALIGPGALLTVLTGLVLTMMLIRYDSAPSVWLMVMQGAGVVGGLLVLFLAVPTAMKLARLSPVGPTEPLFTALRRRQAIVGSLAGALGLLALLAGAFYG